MSAFKKLFFIFILMATSYVQAGFFDELKNINLEAITGSTQNEVPAGLSEVPAGLSNDEIVLGLKQALEKGSQAAVKNLSAQGGFLNQADVRVPIPTSLLPLASTLKMLGQEDLVTAFQATLNQAAEKAVPAAATIFSDSIQAMSVDDAIGIINGPSNAATEYFKKHSSSQLLDAFLPVTRQATDQAGVTASYKQLLAAASSYSSLTSAYAPDLDSFIAQKTVDALFLRIAEQEKLIRENPAARTTDLLKKLFTSSN